MQLPDSPDRAQQALVAAKTGTWIWDLSSDYIHWDLQCRSLFGVAQDGKPIVRYSEFFHWIHPEDRAATEQALRRTLASDAAYDMAHRVCWPDGSVHWLRCKGALSADRKYIIGISIDMDWILDKEECARLFALQRW